MKKIFLIGFLLLSTAHIFAQHLWIETKFSTKLSKKLELSVDPELRFNEDFELNEYFIQPAIEYKFHKYFRLGAGYRFGFNVNKNDEHESFGRFHVDAKTGFKWKNFNPKFRLRFTNADDFSDDNAPTNYLRYKLKLEYNIRKLNLEPYIMNEWYQDLDEKEFSKSRFESGLMYKVNKHHKIGAYFRTNNYLNSNKDTKKIIGLSYKYSF